MIDEDEEAHLARISANLEEELDTISSLWPLRHELPPALCRTLLRRAATRARVWRDGGARSRFLTRRADRVAGAWMLALHAPIRDVPWLALHPRRRCAHEDDLRPRRPTARRELPDGGSEASTMMGYTRAEENRMTRRPGIGDRATKLESLRAFEARASVLAEACERFWPKVECSSDPNACWIWKGSQRRANRKLRRIAYGTFRFMGRTWDAHRVAFMLSVDDPTGSVVRHACDNGLCVNPAHLELGTQRDNVLDMHRRGRASLPPIRRGSAHPRATLTARKVHRIRDLHRRGQSFSAIGRAVGCTRGAARAVALRISWKHL